MRARSSSRAGRGPRLGRALLACVPLLAGLLPGAAHASAQAGEALSGPALERATRVVRWYACEGELARDELVASLRELDARLLEGPWTAACRPKVWTIGVDFPASLEERALERALRKLARAVEPLRVSCFAGGEEKTPQIPSYGVGLTTQDALIGMASELRWHDNHAGFVRFFAAGTKLGAAEIAERYAKLFAPFGGSRLGEPARDELTLRFGDEAEPKALQRAAKKLRRVAGVHEVRCDEEARTLALVLGLEALERVPAPAGELAGGWLRPRFELTPVLELLEHEGLVPREALPAPRPGDAEDSDGAGDGENEAPR